MFQLFFFRKCLYTMEKGHYDRSFQFCKEMGNFPEIIADSSNGILIYMKLFSRLLKTELRGTRGDLRRPFDRAWKDYHERFQELERQKKKAAKEAGEVLNFRKKTYEFFV